MIEFTKWFYLVFGLLAAVGGYMGYKKAGSKASVIAGSICGVLLVAACLLLNATPPQLNPALIIGLLVSVVILGQFLPKLLHHEFKPHIVLTSLLSTASLVVTIVSWYKK
jgi:uncharacterized membrane protein (UPF0136 family)